MIRIKLNGNPKSFNKFAGRQNVWDYRSEKEAWTNYVHYKTAGRRPKEPFKHAKVTITYIFPTKVRHDPDNYSGKFLLDGLTQAGLIQDDSFNNIQLLLRAFSVKGKKATIVDIEEMSDAEWTSYTDELLSETPQ